MTTALPDTIRAHVHPDAISSVTRFFTATTTETLNELLQNSRRANASRVTVTIHDGEVTVQDDGDGIADPRSLLAFGMTKWDQRTTAAEDPAGMGFYSLSRFAGVSITSGSAQEGTRWRVKLDPDHFLGQKDATVEMLPHDARSGTSITFRDEKANIHDVEQAARFYPLPVTCNGQEMERHDFLENARHVENWQGTRIGVNRGLANTYRTQRHEINFHGITISTNLPSVQEIGGPTWTVAIDVAECPRLELALPARHELIQNDFLDQLRHACQRIIYRAILQHPEPVDVSHEDYTRAHAMGIQIPEARRLLRRWEPRTARARYYYPDHNNPKETPPYDAIIVGRDIMTDPDQQAFARAAQRTGIMARLWQDDPKLHGYPWYEKLAKATHASASAQTGDQETTIIDANGDHHEVAAAEPDAIEFTLHIRTADGTQSVITIPADVAFGVEELYWSEDPQLIITRDSDIHTGELTQLLMDAFFCPSEDVEADSFDTQEEQWTDEFTKLAAQTLLSSEDAMREAIRRAVNRHVTQHLNSGYAAVITVSHDRETSVVLRPPAPRHDAAATLEKASPPA